MAFDRFFLRGKLMRGYFILCDSTFCGRRKECKSGVCYLDFCLFYLFAVVFKSKFPLTDSCPSVSETFMGGRILSFLCLIEECVELRLKSAVPQIEGQ